VRILVCVKRVPAPGARINVTADEQAVDSTHLGFTTSPHEECAVEEAVQIVEQQGGEVTVLTLGPPEAEEQLRYAASVGAASFVLVPTDGSEWDPQRTAAAITEAVRAREAAEGEYDLILFGNESADAGGFQVGIDGAITARREIDGGFEVYEVPRPAVLGVKEGINLPRYPTMKGRLASKKADIERLEVDGEHGGQAKVRLHRPEETVSETTILGTGADAASPVVDLLEELGVLS
jgi:electron transfer flavoprotein beta subunit